MTDEEEITHHLDFEEITLEIQNQSGGRFGIGTYPFDNSLFDGYARQATALINAAREMYNFEAAAWLERNPEAVILNPLEPTATGAESHLFSRLRTAINDAANRRRFR